MQRTVVYYKTEPPQVKKAEEKPKRKSRKKKD